MAPLWDTSLWDTTTTVTTIKPMLLLLLLAATEAANCPAGGPDLRPEGCRPPDGGECACCDERDYPMTWGDCKEGTWDTTCKCGHSATCPFGDEHVPEGCYTGGDGHYCVCCDRYGRQHTQKTCAAKGYSFTDCNCGTMSSASSVAALDGAESGVGRERSRDDSAASAVNDHGCYDIEDTHTCDCTLSQAECGLGSGLWTSGCGCDCDDPEHGCSQGDPEPHYNDDGAGAEEYGCYLGGQCDCDISREECLKDADGGRVNSWLSGCECAERAEPPPSPAPPPPPVVGTVTASVAAECPVAQYESSFVREELRETVSELAGVNVKAVSVTVSDQGCSDEGSAGIVFVVQCDSAHSTISVAAKLGSALGSAAAASSALGLVSVSAPTIVNSDVGAVPPLPGANNSDVGAMPARPGVEEPADGGLDGGAIAGIAIGAIAGTILVALVLWLLGRKKSKGAHGVMRVEMEAATRAGRV